MSVWSPEEIMCQVRLRCPTCKHNSLDHTDQYFECRNCDARYSVRDGIIMFALKAGSIKSEIMTFWGDLYKQLYDSFDYKLSKLSPEEMESLLDEFVPMLQHMEHLPVTEVDLAEIESKKVLEVGCGAGAHSALFKRHGGKVVALDITMERAISAQHKLKLVRQGYGCAIQGDAESLPFEDDTFDIVYSFGVLHHTENTEKAVDELYRVLKPEGQVVVMLYAKSSFYYLLNLLLIQGIIRRNFSYGGRWLGRVTEGTPKYSNVHNPVTRVYSKSEMLQLFGRFHSLRLRKSGFNFSQIPVLCRILPILLVKVGLCKESRAGLLVWNRPLRLETSLELFLGHSVGFNWNIVGRK